MHTLLDPALPHIAFLFVEVFGKPAWMWLGFLALVLGLLAFDLGVLHRKSHAIGIRESLTMSAGYIALGLSFGAWVWWSLGAVAGMAYVTGFALEKALAMDNVFVIAMIFTYFAVPRVHQHRVLFWGILGVIVLRAIMIGVGATVIAEAHWVLYLFAAFLIATGIKMMFASSQAPDLEQNAILGWMRRHLRLTRDFRGSALRVVENGRRAYTPMFVVMVLIAVTDVIFAVDSIPAIFAITLDPFVVLTSNVFAVLGLRALFFLLAGMADRFHLLGHGLAAVLLFIGAKMLLAGVWKIPIGVALGVVAALIAASIAASLLWPPRKADAD